MDFLRYLESIRTPAGETIFYCLTYGGEEIMLLGLSCILFWCVNKKLAYRMMFTYMFSALVINSMKLCFRIERPWVRDPGFKAVEKAKASATGYSFPSGHTQNAATMYGTIAYKIRKLWAVIVFTVLILLVMLSRMYLGVHTPADVITSFAVTTAVVIGINMIADRITLDKRRRLIITCILIAAAIVYMLFSLWLTNTGRVSYENTADGFKGVGAGLAFAICWYIESVYIDFDVKCRNIRLQILKVFIGVGGILLIRSGIKALFGSNIAADMIRYFLMLSWAMLAMPIIIRKFFNRPQDGEEKRGFVKGA